MLKLGITDSDRRDVKPSPARPIEPIEVPVHVRPRLQNLPKKTDPTRRQIEEQNRRNIEHAKKVEKVAAEQVRKAMRDAAPAGDEAQVEAAKRAATEIAKALDKNTIREIVVKIPGRRWIVRRTRSV